MAYSINQMIVDGKQLVVALDWSYTNADGSLSGEHKLLAPYGSTPVADVNEDIAIKWLKEQLQNTSVEFDAAIAQRNSEAEYSNNLVEYVKDDSGNFAPKSQTKSKGDKAEK